MNYIRIDDCDLNNGDGVRIVLWVSGCHHDCDGCHNMQTHDYNAGQKYTQETEEEIMKLLENKYIDGITISGGDPLSGGNYDVILDLCTKIRNKFKDKKTIWVWTGYTIEELRENDKIHISKVIDVLVDGKYVKELDCTKEKEFYGSSNQRVWDFEDSDWQGKKIRLLIERSKPWQK